MWYEKFVLNKTRISFNPLLLPLETFLKPSCSFQTWMVSILPPHRRFKDLIKEKVLLRCERKRVPSDSNTFFYLFVYLFLHNLCVLLLFWVSQVFMLCFVYMFLFVFNFVYFVFDIKIIKKNWKIRKIQKQCEFCVHWYLCTLGGHWNKVF